MKRRTEQPTNHGSNWEEGKAGRDDVQMTGAGKLSKGADRDVVMEAAAGTECETGDDGQ